MDCGGRKCSLFIPLGAKSIRYGISHYIIDEKKTSTPNGWIWATFVCQLISINNWTHENMESCKKWIILTIINRKEGYKTHLQVCIYWTANSWCIDRWNDWQWNTKYWFNRTFANYYIATGKDFAVIAFAHNT